MRTPVSLPGLSDFAILTVAGLNGSGLEHWQSHWDFRFQNCRRVDMGDWANPVRSHWIEQLSRAMRGAAQPVLLVAHSLGCHAVAWWAAERWSPIFQDVVAGAMLVAPPDVERPGAPGPIVGFAPVPRKRLPFPTLMVISRNDPFASFETSIRIAHMWGSDLVDAGNAGHINADSGLRQWPEGLRLLSNLAQRVGRQRSSAVWPLVQEAPSITPKGLEIGDAV